MVCHLRKPVAQYPVRRGQHVYINDSALRLAEAEQIASQQLDEDGFPLDRARDVPLRFYLNAPPTLHVQPAVGEDVELIVTSFSASFGGNPTTQTRFTSGVGAGIGSRLVAISSNEQGCREYTSAESEAALDTIVLVHRGSCTFIEKLVFAKRAGARGVVVISDSDMPINPSADEEEIEYFAKDNLDEAALVIVKHTDGTEIAKLLAVAASRTDTDVLVTVEPEGQAGKTETSDAAADKRQGKVQERESIPDNRVLYLNGHPLLNTRLLV